MPLAIPWHRPNRLRRCAGRKSHAGSEEGYPLHSFRTLLAALATQSRYTCQFGDGDLVIPISKTTDPSPLQIEAFRLLQQEP